MTVCAYSEPMQKSSHHSGDFWSQVCWDVHSSTCDREKVKKQLTWEDSCSVKITHSSSLGGKQHLPFLIISQFFCRCLVTFTLCYTHSVPWEEIGSYMWNREKPNSSSQDQVCLTMTCHSFNVLARQGHLIAAFDKVFFQILTFNCQCLRNVPKSNIKRLFKGNSRKIIFILEPDLKLLLVLQLFHP